MILGSVIGDVEVVIYFDWVVFCLGFEIWIGII